MRLAVGFHFFKEGTTKLRDGNFTAEHFLRSAKGPFAPMFHMLLEDESGRQRLCVKDAPEATGSQKFEFDTELTTELWRDFVDKARSYYRFGDVELLEKLANDRQLLADQIHQARAAQDKSVNTATLERDRAQLEDDILDIRKQDETAKEILDSHIEFLEDWLLSNQTEIFQFYATEGRLDGFQRDGENRDQVATYVASLREQVDSIRKDRQKQLKEWTTEIESIWDSLEAQINALAVNDQAEKAPFAIHRNFDQENSKLKVINKVIPWFDTIIGVLLMLGLFSRVASAAGGLFLLSVIASQPPWVPGTIDTYYQSIEMFAMFVLFATCAGRVAGLDYFFTNQNRNTEPTSLDSENAS